MFVNTIMIWHKIQSAKSESTDLHVIFLDLANVFGSVPHSVLWAAFEFLKVPEPIMNLFEAYFKDLQFCFTTPDFTSIRQRLEVDKVRGSD